MQCVSQRKKKRNAEALRKPFQPGVVGRRHQQRPPQPGAPYGVKVRIDTFKISLVFGTIQIACIFALEEENNFRRQKGETIGRLEENSFGCWKCTKGRARFAVLQLPPEQRKAMLPHPPQARAAATTIGSGTGAIMACA